MAKQENLLYVFLFKILVKYTLFHCKGKVEAEFELLTTDEADQNPVGLGRSDPHALPQPRYVTIKNFVKVLYWAPSEIGEHTEDLISAHSLIRLRFSQSKTKTKNLSSVASINCRCCFKFPFNKRNRYVPAEEVPPP